MVIKVEKNIRQSDVRTVRIRKSILDCYMHFKIKLWVQLDLQKVCLQAEIISDEM